VKNWDGKSGAPADDGRVYGRKESFDKAGSFAGSAGTWDKAAPKSVTESEGMCSWGGFGWDVTGVTRTETTRFWCGRCSPFDDGRSCFMSCSTLR